MVSSPPAVPQNQPVAEDVILRSEARKPEMNPTLGIPVTVNRSGTPRHRLVAIGDSLTQGFQSGAIFNTSLSHPAMIAKELGWSSSFRFPTYGGPGDGLPLNLEKLARQLEQEFGSTIDLWEMGPMLIFLRQYLDEIEDYWERGEGTRLPTGRTINHNLSVYGWDLRNTLSHNADRCLQTLKQNPAQDDFLRQIVEYHNERAALHVLNTARNSAGQALTPLQAAAALGIEGTQETGAGDGIETLLILIGSNNALGSILTFKIRWSDKGYDDINLNDQYTVWRPIHFQAEFNQIVTLAKQIRARHIIWATVPHVTIAPYARGTGGKVQPGSRYFPYYTLPWIKDSDFNPKRHPHLTGFDALVIDSAIDQYNDAITAAVRQARQEGRDWYLFDMAGLLDRLAARRYINDPTARPSWWDAVGGAYPLPPVLQALSPVPDSRFYISGPKGRIQGGLFSLDGIHPTTIGYGILAQEVIKVMQQAGVKFYESDGKTERKGEIQISFPRLVAIDTLISNPPRSVVSIIDKIGWIDQNFNIVSGLVRSNL
jgi:hypothetical protein